MPASALPPPAAVVFDLDGTLVDTVGARIAAWEEALGTAGVRVSREELEPMIGMDGRRLAHEAAAAAGRGLTDAEAEELDALSGTLFDARNRHPAPLPGARALLGRLDALAIPWAVATSSRREQVARSVAALRLDAEPRIVDGTHVEHAKPAPDLLLLAGRRLGSDPARTWYVGDSTWDMRAAAAAGMLAVGVLAGAAVGADALREAGADLVVATLDELDLPRGR